MDALVIAQVKSSDSSFAVDVCWLCIALRCHRHCYFLPRVRRTKKRRRYPDCGA